MAAWGEEQEMAVRTGRRPGQQDTRQEILDAARPLFAELGYARTSMRAVAREAGVDPALIHHYFGTKEGLFQATLELPIDPTAVLEGLPDGPVEELPARLLDRFLSVWDNPEVSPAMISVLRRALDDPQKAEPLRRNVVQQFIAEPLRQILHELDPSTADQRISLLVTQLMGVIMSRHLVGLEPVASLTTDQLRELLLPALAHHMFGDLS